MQKQNPYLAYTNQNFQGNSNIEQLVDLKIAQNTFNLHQENFQAFSNFKTNQNSNNIRLTELESQIEKLVIELNDKISEPNSAIKNAENETFENTDKTEEDEDSKLYTEIIDIDTYLYLTLAFSFTSLPLFIGYINVIFCKSGLAFRERMKFLFTVLVSPFLLLPGIATMLLQLICIYYVYNEAELDFSALDKFTYQALKILILIIFVFMVAKETTQSINSFFFCYTHAKNKKLFFLAGCFIPSLIQCSMGFLILYVGFLLIASTDDAINLIQNFASVFILLEIDNILMDFLKLSKISIFIVRINDELDILRRKIGSTSIFSKNIIKKVLVENSIEIDYEKEDKIYKIVYLICRALLIILLIGFSILVWIYDIMERMTSQ